MPLKIVLTPGETHDSQAAAELLEGIAKGETVLADRAYDADWIRNMLNARGAWANIPPKSNRKEKLCFSPWLYKKRNVVERFFNKLKYFRRIATRYDKLATNFLAAVHLTAAICY